MPHNDPDPDAIASAFGMERLLNALGVPSVEIAYQGIIGRAENRALVHYLDQPLRLLTDEDLEQPVCYVLVDTQPGTGNNAIKYSMPCLIVLDHHQLREETALATYADVRPRFGATSTIVLEYLLAAGIEPDEKLATALFYGIKTDTMGLVRGASDQDIEAFHHLQSLVDLDALEEIQRAQVPASYFRSLVTAFQSARIHGPLAMAYVGEMSYPDQAAEVANSLLRLQDIVWVMCSGVYGGKLILAVRSRSRGGGAGQLVRSVVGGLGMAGGHGSMAGGQVRLNGADPATLAAELGRRAMAYLDLPAGEAGEALI